MDGFVIGETPITQQPLTADPDRELRISLPGYQEITTQVDLTQDTVFQPIVLTSLAQAEGSAENDTSALTPTLGIVEAATGEATGGVEADTPAPEPEVEALLQNEVTLNISDTTWLEVYQSTARGVGERLVYTTVQPGETFTFELPVYLRVGNAAGVEVTLNGQEVGALGSRGEVLDQSYVQE